MKKLKQDAAYVLETPLQNEKQGNQYLVINRLTQPAVDKLVNDKSSLEVSYRFQFEGWTEVIKAVGSFQWRRFRIGTAAGDQCEKMDRNPWDGLVAGATECATAARNTRGKGNLPFGGPRAEGRDSVTATRLSTPRAMLVIDAVKLLNWDEDQFLGFQRLWKGKTRSKAAALKHRIHEANAIALFAAFGLPHNANMTHLAALYLISLETFHDGLVVLREGALPDRHLPNAGFLADLQRVWEASLALLEKHGQKSWFLLVLVPPVVAAPAVLVAVVVLLPLPPPPPLLLVLAGAVLLVAAVLRPALVVGAVRFAAGGGAHVAAPPPGPPAVVQGPYRLAPSEHCYRCLQAAALRGRVELPFCTGYDASGIKCVRCKRLHQACQTFPASALPEAQAVVDAQLALEATHPLLAT
ncbi:hypothetical protein CNMCM5793_002820 [Aspergillus hiratsukae]|uniref:Uncharacterized protein n=1 Tax=Aspergillus hiratsukae TaxID=1194566 RepID=A0A8H6UF42_9EURO|nr:hypothetical protein CNMCM5793_002820 [Aspergillus hiratsukae]